MFSDSRNVLRAAWRLCILVLPLVVSLAVPVWAEWLPGGLPVCTAVGYQGSLVSAPDGLGGMLCVWQDHRSAQLKIYAQRIDASGNLLWTTNGVLVGANPGYHPGICADGTGGAYITWESRGGGYGSTFVQHLNGAGVKLWASAGISIAGGSASSDNSVPMCAEDGLGGVFVAWVQEISPPSGDLQLCAQRMGTAGNLLWGTQGIVVTRNIYADKKFDMVTDLPSDGALIGWADSLSYAYVQRLDLDGNPCMVSPGRFLDTVVPGSYVRVADRNRTSGGVYAMIRPSSISLAVYSIESGGYKRWSAGVTEGGYSDPTPTNDYRVADDGLLGVWALWDVVNGSGVGQGILAQRVESDGGARFADPIQVSDGTTGNYLPDATVSYYLLVTWVDDSGDIPHLRYTHVDPDMGFTYTEKLVPGGYSSARPCIVANEPDVASHPFPLIAWQDERAGGGEIDIYAAGLDVNGDPAQPNLVATALNPATEPGVAGSGLNSFYVKVKNTGTCAADSFWTTIFPNQAQQPHVGDEPPGTVQSVHCGPLAAGDSVVVDVQITAPLTGQTWSMWAFADYQGDVEEFDDEGDNTFGPRSYEWRALANLVIARVTLSDSEPDPMEWISATVTVKNTGHAIANNIWIDYFANSASAPPAGSHGGQRYAVFQLSPGDSISWTTTPVTSTEFMRFSTYFRVDTDNLIVEENETDNLSGPHYVDWQIPPEDGWPRGGGGKFHSSPAIANLDSDPTTLEVVIGCDDRKVYAWRPNGAAVPGWPVTLSDSVKSSPAVGDITGDYHNEVVVGCRDGKLYAYDYHGAKLWEYSAGSPVNTTPVLADFDDDDKLEIVFSAGGDLCALEGDGRRFSGSWPYSAAEGGTFTSPAVGNVNGAGGLEIAVIAYGYTKPVRSYVYLLKTNGTLYSGSWPVTVDTVVVADPVIGDVVTPSTDLEIVTGGINGKVYLWKPTGAAWSAPRVPGTIETSPSLANLEGHDAFLEIVVTSRRYVGMLPPHWEDIVTAIDGSGTIMTGWPKIPGDWFSNAGAVPSAIILGSSCKIMQGIPDHNVYALTTLTRAPYGFPIDAGGPVVSSAAVGNLDNDTWLELVVAGGDSVRCFELCSSSGYALGDLWWPMFRHDRARTGCYGFVVPTDVAEPESVAPEASRIRSIYPNPFNPITRIAFDLDAKARAELAIYDVSGRRVAVLVDRELEAGRHEAFWNGRTAGGATAASGIYFCTLKTGSVSETKKIVLLR